MKNKLSSFIIIIKILAANVPVGLNQEGVGKGLRYLLEGKI